MNVLDLPYLGYGVGLRAPHIDDVMENRPDVDFFEVISENYMEGDVSTLARLERVRADYPIVLHGVSLSIGTVDPLNSDYLRKLKALADRLEAPWISDHLCWTGTAHANTHDLLPVPYTEEALRHIVERVKRVQDFLKRRILLENPSAYLTFSRASMPECEFIARLAEEADCGLLLDVNNVYVTAFNQRTQVQTYLDAIPLGRVAQVHLAGHTHKGTHIVDTHSGPVCEEVRNMYAYLRQKTGDVTTMIEWDEDIPDFPELQAEMDAMRRLPPPSLSLPDFSGHAAPALDIWPYETQLRYFQLSVLQPDSRGVPPATEWATSLEGFSADDQIAAYRRAYRARLCGRVREDAPALCAYIGEEEAERLISAYVESAPSSHYNMTRYVERFPAFVRSRFPNDVFAGELADWEIAIPLLFLDKDGDPVTEEGAATLSGDSVLRLRPCVRIFAFSHALHDFYRAHRDGTPIPAPIKEASHAGLSRIGEKVYRFDLTDAEYAALSSFKNGNSLEEALAAHAGAMDENDVATCFSKAMRYRLFEAVYNISAMHF